jgi:hypothetical protein
MALPEKFEKRLNEIYNKDGFGVCCRECFIGSIEIAYKELEPLLKIVKESKDRYGNFEIKEALEEAGFND